METFKVRHHLVTGIIVNGTIKAVEEEDKEVGEICQGEGEEGV
jgi:hypothetical protein